MKQSDEHIKNCKKLLAAKIITTRYCNYSQVAKDKVQKSISCWNNFRLLSKKANLWFILLVKFCAVDFWLMMMMINLVENFPVLFPFLTKCYNAINNRFFFWQCLSRMSFWFFFPSRILIYFMKHIFTKKKWMINTHATKQTKAWLG